MPFAENGYPLDEEARRRLNEIMGFVLPAPPEEMALGRRLDDLRKELEGERDKDDETVNRADILRRAYTERYV